MRVIAGAAKGRTLAVPAAGTRPLTGRAREALFSALEGRVRGASVLDLYAGSGSIGLEALSRGAVRATFVEHDRNAFAVLRANIDAVGLGGEAVRRDVASYLATEPGPFDIAFVDPPYSMPAARVDGVLAALSAVMEADGIIVLHRRTGTTPPTFEFPGSMSERRYGDTQLYSIRLEARS